MGTIIVLDDYRQAVSTDSKRDDHKKEMMVQKLREALMGYPVPYSSKPKVTRPY